MPSVIVPVPAYPDVPNLPGVPPLARNAGSGVVSVITNLLTGDDPGIAAQMTGPQWGVFDTDNNPLVTPDSVTAFDFGGDARIEKYPIEGGSFSSYNKVVPPFEPRLTMTQGGTVADRTAFLQALEALRQSIDVCNVVTPELTMQSVNCVRYTYNRKASQGATLIEAEVHFEQVNQTGTASFSNTAQPTGASQVNDGQVQATTPTAAQAAAAEPEAGGAPTG